MMEHFCAVIKILAAAPYALRCARCGVGVMQSLSVIHDAVPAKAEGNNRIRHKSFMHDNVTRWSCMTKCDITASDIDNLQFMMACMTKRDSASACVAQAELQTVTGDVAALDDDLDMIQQQLEHQMQAQDQNQDDARLVMQLFCGCIVAALLTWH